MAVDAAPRDETTCGRLAAESQPSADNIWHEVSTRTSRRRGGPQGGETGRATVAAQTGVAQRGRHRAHRAPHPPGQGPRAGLQGEAGRRRRPRERPQGRLAQSSDTRPAAARRQGVNRLSRRKSIQRISEERASRKYRNLRVLNSYWVGEDGSQKWHEVILVDPNHPAIENDGDLGWIASDDHKGRASVGSPPPAPRAAVSARAARVRRRPARASPATTGRAK